MANSRSREASLARNKIDITTTRVKAIPQLNRQYHTNNENGLNRSTHVSQHYTGGTTQLLSAGWQIFVPFFASTKENKFFETENYGVSGVAFQSQSNYTNKDFGVAAYSIDEKGMPKDRKWTQVVNLASISSSSSDQILSFGGTNRTVPSGKWYYLGFGVNFLFQLRLYDTSANYAAAANDSFFVVQNTFGLSLNNVSLLYRPDSTHISNVGWDGTVFPTSFDPSVNSDISYDYFSTGEVAAPMLAVTQYPTGDQDYIADIYTV